MNDEVLSRRDVHRAITDTIASAIEAGAKDYVMPWHQTVTRPLNAGTGKPYHGVNVVALWAAGRRRNFGSAYWATYRQWGSLEAQVRKGERGSMIVFYKSVEIEKDQEEADAESATAAQVKLIARASWVFNADQVDGWAPPAPAPQDGVEIRESAEAFIAASRADIRHGGDMAYYDTMGDFIAVPHAQRFIGTKTSTATEAYYSVILHELTHWTGAPTRLARNLRARFGDHAYAMEELIAELSAAYLCAGLGIANEPRLDHAAYVASWLQVLKEDRTALFSAASKASVAAMQMLQADWDPTFSAASFGFRPKRSAHQAVERAQAYIASGHAVVVDIDLEKFFDRVNHDILMGLVAKRVADKRLLKLTRGFLTAGVLDGGLISPTEEGTPQGGPLSPLLSNLMLDVLDKELETRGHRFVRYADDCNIYVRSQRAGERVMAGIERFLAKRLKLRVNKAKSAVARPSVRKFLGFSFTGGKEPRRRIAPQAIARFKAKVRELTRRTRGQSLGQIVKELSIYLVGWHGYFGFCQTPSVLRSLDEWTRRRLRAIAWKQWKRGRTRYAELRRRGVGRDLAAQTAGSPHGPWRLANSPALNMALPNRLFGSLGLASVAAPPLA